MNKAVFLDRDGVINDLVLNPNTGNYEAPQRIEDFNLKEGVIESLLLLKDAGFMLFLITNQPDYAKGKTSLETLESIRGKSEDLMVGSGIGFEEYFYCYHHPKGVIEGYSYECECRKPKPFFIFEANKKYDLDLSSSWFVGDRSTDVECGKAGGMKTIFINEPTSSGTVDSSDPDYEADSLVEAVDIIVKGK
jgi:D-glycero-D-manno-heptose 1,7-bisphosphate phosphatase